jgi:hypothetical protein
MMRDCKFIFSELLHFLCHVEMSFALMYILSMLDVLVYFVMACNGEFMK